MFIVLSSLLKLVGEFEETAEFDDDIGALVLIEFTTAAFRPDVIINSAAKSLILFNGVELEDDIGRVVDDVSNVVIISVSWNQTRHSMQNKDKGNGNLAMGWDKTKAMVRHKDFLFAAVEGEGENKQRLDWTMPNNDTMLLSVDGQSVGG